MPDIGDIVDNILLGFLNIDNYGIAVIAHEGHQVQYEGIESLNPPIGTSSTFFSETTINDEKRHFLFLKMLDIEFLDIILKGRGVLNIQVQAMKPVATQITTPVKNHQSRQFRTRQRPSVQ